MNIGEIIALFIFVFPLVGLIIGGTVYLFYNIGKGTYDNLDVHKLRDCPKIGFSDFEVWYRLNPSDWELYEKAVYKSDARVKLRFSFIDTILYRFWHKRNTKNKSTEQTNEQMMKVLKSVKKDIERFSMQNK